jgi:YbbR domain-containing protein
MKIRRIFDNIEIKLICLLLAVVMWLYAKEGTEAVRRIMASGEQGRITFREVPIKLVDSEEQEQWEADPSKIILEVECPTAEVEKSSFQAVVSLTQKDKEKGSVTLTAGNVELPKGLIFVRAKPDEIHITRAP